MSKQIRTLVISLVVVVALVAGLLLLKFMPGAAPATTSSAASSSTTAISLISTADAQKVVSVHMKTTEAEFTIRKGSKSTYSVDELKGLPISEVPSSIFTDATSLTADRVIAENASDLSIYGLKDSKVEVDLTTSDGKTFSYIYGALSPSGTAHYLCEKGSNKVYLTTSALQNFTGHALTDLVDKTLLTTDSSNLSKLSEIDFGGSASKAPFVLKQVLNGSGAAAGNGQPTFQVTSPATYETNVTSINTMVGKLSSISADTVVSLDVSADSLAKYGLKDPLYTFSRTYDKNKTTLLFGNTFTQNGNTYIYTMVEGRNIIYSLLVSSFSYYNWSLVDAATRTPFSPTLTDLKTITVTDSTGSYQFNVNTSGSSTKVTYNGTTLKEDNFESYFTVLSGVQTEDVSSAVSGTPLVTIKYEYKDSSKAPVTVQFIPIDDRKVFYSVNGKGSFYSLITDVNKILTDTQSIIKNQTIPQT